MKITLLFVTRLPVGLLGYCSPPVHVTFYCFEIDDVLFIRKHTFGFI